MAFTKLGTLTAGDTITASGINFGMVAWTTYAPTYTNVVVGNGTVVAKYAVIGRTYVVIWTLAFGTTSSVGAASVSLPVTAAAGQGSTLFPNFCADVSAGQNYATHTYLSSTTTMSIAYQNALAGTVGFQSGTLPFTWATSDLMAMRAVYEGTS